MVKEQLRIAELEKQIAEKTAELLQRGEELSVIRSVQEALTTEKDLQTIYDLVGNRIKELFDAQAVIIASFDHETGQEAFNYTIENGERFYPESRPFDDLRRHMINTKLKVVINTADEAKNWFKGAVVPGTKYMQSGMFVPLITGKVVTGYVSLQNVDKENAFMDSEVKLLETLANSMSAALQNARLLKETEQRTAELAVINSVQEGLAKELDIQSIYDLVGNRIRDLFDAQVVGIGTFDHDLETETLHYLIEKGERYYPTPKPINSLRRHIIQSREKLVINKNFGTVAETFGIKPVPGTQQPKSAVYMPLVIGDKVTGYASLQNIDKENAFTDADLRLLETLANTMGVALENARLFDETNRLLKETEQQKAELGVINSVQEGLAKELDMQAIYDLVGNRIRDLFNAQAVIIATFDHDTATEHFKYLIEDGQRFYLASRPYDKLRQHLIMTRQKIIINSNYEEAYAKFGLRTLPGTNMTKSGVFVPLVIGDRVNSYISLQNNEIENAFSDSDIRLLETLANSMSVALENARLFDETTRLLKETEQRTAELGVINSVQEGLASELDMQAIYDMIGNKIRDIFDAQAVVIATFDHDNGMERFDYLWENGEKFNAPPRRYDKLRYQLIMSKQRILINNNVEEAFKEFGLKVVADSGMPKSLLFVPLVVGNKVTSYVSLQHTEKENAFSESDVRLLETLANSMSVALENARLFAETTRLLKETEQKTAELGIINSVQEGLASKLDIQSIYDLVGEKIKDVFPAQGISIGYYDSSTHIISFPYYYFRGKKIHFQPFKLGKGMTTHVINSGKHLLVNGFEEMKKYDMVLAENETEENTCQTWLGVPMVSGGLVNGMIKIENYERLNAYTESDISLLQTLANSASVALENAKLFDETNRLLKETEQRNAELAVINSVQESLVAQLDMSSIYELVGEKIRNIFNAQVIDIVTYDPAQNIIVDQYSFEKGDRTLVGSRPPNGFRKHVIQTGHALVHNENVEQALKEFDNPILQGAIPKSQVYIPMIASGEVKGVISLQNLDKEHAFSDSDVSLITTLANSMSVALESARLFDETNRLLKETEQRTAELAVINSVQEGLAKELDMNGIYNLVGDRLCDLFPDTQTLVIRTFDLEKGTEHFHYAIEKGIKLKVADRPFMWANKYMIEHKKPLDIRENYVETAKKHGGTGVTTGKPPKSAVFVPMLVGDVVKGSVSLQNVDKENAFTESDLRLLTTITNSMSVALENARLFDETNRLLKETEQRTAELAVINSVQDGLVREIDMQAIYDLVGHRICKLFDTQTVVIRTFDLEHEKEEWRFVMEKGERLYSDPRPLMWANRELIQTKHPLMINEKYTDVARQHGSKGVSKGLAPRSAMFVPMMVGDLVRGSVSLQNVDREFAFNEADLRLLTTLTNSMSVALENARLFAETNVLLNQSKQRAAELSTVNSISKALASQLDPGDLINMVGDQLKELFKANIVYLALLDSKTKIINFPYQYGDTMDPLKLGEGLTSKVILTGESVLVNKDLQEWREQQGIESIGVPAASGLWVPIPIGDENLGVLSVQSTEHENRFNENDLRLLSTIASSVGVALRNANLFEDVKQAKLEAEAATKQAERANDAKSAFLSTVSHELRTPLTSVLGFTKIIRKRLDEKIFPVTIKAEPKTEKTIKQVSENLNVVISEGERLTHLINDVLDLAKIEAGKMEWNFEDVSMAEIAERAVAATSALFDQKPLQLVKDIDLHLAPIKGDKDKLIQVIINLISNAVKFTDKGTITCKVFNRNKEQIVSITDTGIGISPEDYKAVFEQFKQVGGDTLTDKPKGTGLGLPICKQIVEHHGGRIWLESERGKGSTFYFALPANQKQNGKAITHLDDLVKQLKEQVASSRLNEGEKAATILIVDDDDSIRSLLQQELTDAGYLIEEAANGKEALDHVRKNKPDLIILDIMMPEMNGFDVAAVLKNDPDTMDIPIIVLSVVQDKARGFRIGIDRYLTKPIDTGLLFNEIGSLLEQGKSKKKVMIVDEDTATLSTLSEVLEAKGYHVTGSNENEMKQKAVDNVPDIIIMNSVLSLKNELVQTLRFEKGLENVLFLVYQ